MVKRRTLRPWIQTVLELVTFLIIGFFCSLYDFKPSLRNILVFIGLAAIMILNTVLLKKYGRYEEDV